MADEVEVLSRPDTAGSVLSNASVLSNGSMAEAAHRTTTKRQLVSGHRPAVSFSRRCRAAFRDVLQFARGQLVLHPDGEFRRHWDWAIVIGVVYNVISMPWFLALNPELGLQLMPLDVIILFFMTLDMAITFRSGFVAVGGAVVFDAREATRRYVRGPLFALDLISVLPIEFLAWCLPNENFTRAFWYSLLKVKHLLRLHKLLANPRVDAQFQSPRSRVAKIFVAWALLGHLFACVIVLVATNQPNGGTYNWIIAAGMDPASTAEGDIYITALYWSAATLTTVGSVRWSFVSTTEHVVAMVILILTLAFYAAVFSSIGASLTSAQHQARTYQAQLDSAKEYAAVNDLPPTLAQKMAAYEDARWNQTHGFKMDEMLKRLPLSVQSEVLLYIHSALVSRVPFVGCSERFLDALILRLGRHPPAVLLPGDYAFREGDTCRHLWFIREGEVEVTSDNPITQVEETIGTVSVTSPAPFFGELAVLLGMARTASVRATQKTVCTILSSADFFELVGMFPREDEHEGMALRLREEAALRLGADWDRVQKASAGKKADATTGATNGPAGLNRQATFTAVTALGAVIRARIVRLEQGQLGEDETLPTMAEIMHDEGDSESDSDEEGPPIRPRIGSIGTASVSASPPLSATRQAALPLDQLVRSSSEDEPVTASPASGLQPSPTDHGDLPGLWAQEALALSPPAPFVAPAESTPPPLPLPPRSRTLRNSANAALSSEADAQGTSAPVFDHASPPSQRRGLLGHRRQLSNTEGGSSGHTPPSDRRLLGGSSGGSLGSLGSIGARERRSGGLPDRGDLLARLAGNSTRELIADSVARAADDALEEAAASAVAGTTGGGTSTTTPAIRKLSNIRYPSGSNVLGPAFRKASDTRPSSARRSSQQGEHDLALESLARLRSRRDSALRASLALAELGEQASDVLQDAQPHLRPRAATAREGVLDDVELSVPTLLLGGFGPSSVPGSGVTSTSATASPSPSTSAGRLSYSGGDGQPRHQYTSPPFMASATAARSSKKKKPLPKQPAKKSSSTAAPRRTR